MALRELPTTLGRSILRDGRPSFLSGGTKKGTRWASSQAAAVKEEEYSDLQELESQSSFVTDAISPEKARSFDPVKRAKSRKHELPPSRYVACCNGVE